MANDNFKPTTIPEVPFPTTQKTGNLSGGETLSPQEIPPKSFPSLNRANEVISATLNTQTRQILSNFSFSRYGAISVGKYVSGVSGDIRVSPNGIVGRNSSGTVTFTIDGTTGNATFRGTLYALAGNIGGFTIQSSYLYAGSSTNTAGMSPADYPFWAGATYANRATAPFYVQPDGTIVATKGTIGGWTIGETTLSSPAVTPTIIFDSAGSITVSNGDDKVVMIVDGGVGYIDFYAGGSRRGRLRGNTAVSGGVQLVDGDFAIGTNNRSLLLRGTSDWLRFGVDGSDIAILTLTATNKYKIVRSDNAWNYFVIDEADDILINPPSGKKVAMGGNIDMNHNNIDEVATIWTNDVNIAGAGANTLQIGAFTLKLTANRVW